MFNILHAVRFPFTWLNVSYQDKDDAKQHGARWNPVEKRWYCNHRTIGDDAEYDYFYLIKKYGTDEQRQKYKKDIEEYVK